jgi:hypothetical protein
MAFLIKIPTDSVASTAWVSEPVGLAGYPARVFGLERSRYKLQAVQSVSALV